MLRRGASISLRLTLWFSGVYLVGLALFGMVMWFDLQQTLTSGRSRTLERRAERLAELLDEAWKEPGAQRDSRFQAFAQATGGGLMEVFRADGSRALPSPGDAAREFPWPREIPGGRDRFSEIESSGQQYRVLARKWVSPEGPLILRVAAPLDNSMTLMRTFRDGLLAAVPALLVLSALGGYLLSRKALAPVDQIAAATRSISVKNLSERLPVPQTRDELQRLSETCNAMLGRLDSAVNEIKRFTADASHELRTPLSVMQTVAELALRNPGTDEESRRAFAEIVDEAKRTSRLLGEMLTLARADDGSGQIGFEPLDLGEVARVASEKARVVAEGRGQRYLVSAPDEPALVTGDYQTLQRLVWILLDNAVKYTPAGGTVELQVTRRGDRVELTVRDTGIGIAPGDVQRVFDRFYRADRSRSEVEGFGLGLAIARCIADAHDAEIDVNSEENVGTTFRVVFNVCRAERMEGTAVIPEKPAYL